jgi:hypothetical protein
MSAYHYEEFGEHVVPAFRIRPNWALALCLLLCLFFWTGVGAVAGLF